MISFTNELSNIFFLVFILGILYAGIRQKIDVFNTFVTGAKGGFEIAINLLPYLVAMIVAIGMLRASGFFELLGHWLGPALDKLGIPHQILPLALIRPFSGAASTGMMAELIHHEGGNSIISKMAATLMGSTETTFYVIAIYFGSIGITRTRHAIPTGLLADFAGVMASIWICRLLFL